MSPNVTSELRNHPVQNDNEVTIQYKYVIYILNKHCSTCSEIAFTREDRTRETRTNAQQRMSICMERKFCSYLLNL